MSGTIEVAAAHRCVHGEGPVWSDGNQSLYWTDIESRTLLSLGVPGGQFQVRPMRAKVCSLSFRERGGLLIAFAKDLSFYDPATGAEQFIVEVEKNLATTRLNDGRCDRQGRFVVGGFDSSEKGLSAAYRLDTDLSLHPLFGGLSSANSTCFSLDGRTMYFADTPQAVIWAFDYDPDTGEPGKRRVFCDFRDQPGVPDGSIVDADGCLWNAQWNGGRVVRYRPDGRVERVIEVPCRHPTSLSFGGPGLDTLFITTSRLTLTEEEARLQPLAGTLLSVRPGVTGVTETRFRG